MLEAFFSFLKLFFFCIKFPLPDVNDAGRCYAMPCYAMVYYRGWGGSSEEHMGLPPNK